MAGSRDYIAEMKVSFVWDNLTKHFVCDDCMAMKTNPNQYTIILPVLEELPVDGTIGSGFIVSEVFGEFRFSSIKRIRIVQNQAILTVDTIPAHTPIN